MPEPLSPATLDRMRKKAEGWPNLYGDELRLLAALDAERAKTERALELCSWESSTKEEIAGVLASGEADTDAT